jgi:hypothetical protein
MLRLKKKKPVETFQPSFTLSPDPGRGKGTKLSSFAVSASCDFSPAGINLKALCLIKPFFPLQPR